MARNRKNIIHGLYVWLIVFMGYGMLAALIRQQPPNIDMWREYALLVVMGILAEWFAVAVPQGSLSFSFAIVCVSFIRFDVTATVIVSVLSTFIANSIINRDSLFRSTVFNGAQYTVSAIAAYAAYDYVGGQIANKLAFDNLPPLFVFIAAYFIVNHLLVTAYLWPSLRYQPWAVWRGALKWDIITYAFASPIGFLMALIYRQTGMLGATLLFIPLLTLKYLFRLYINLETANKELSALYKVANNLGASLDLSETLGLILAETKKVVNYDTGIIYLWEEEDKILLPTAIRSKYAEQLKNIHYNLGEGIIGATAESRQPAIVYDSKSVEKLRNLQGMNQFLRSLLVVPLVVDKKLIGVVAVGKRVPYAFGPKQLQILSSLGAQAAVAMANAMLYKKIEKLAITDGLTQVYNHRYFYKRIEEEAERSRRYGTSFSLIMLDIDYFKKFNDKFGHRAGDSALSFVARSILSNLRNIDVVCRYGGEEFAVLLPETGIESARYVAERIRRAIEDSSFKAAEELPPVHVTVSMGLSTFPEDTVDSNELIEFADQALYYSKERGRNRVHVWNEVPVTALGGKV